MSPRPPVPPSPIGRFRDFLRRGREELQKARDDISSLAGEIGATTQTPQSTPVVERTPPSKILEGTACALCSNEHFHIVYGDLAEALRFARTEGMRHPEVVRRVTHALSELNAMERYDLSPAEVEKFSSEERELVEWALPRSRSIRHLVNQAIMSKDPNELLKAAAEAERTAQEFTAKVMELPSQPVSTVSMAAKCQKCGELENLAEFLEKRRK